MAVGAGHRLATADWMVSFELAFGGAAARGFMTGRHLTARAIGQAEAWLCQSSPSGIHP